MAAELEPSEACQLYRPRPPIQCASTKVYTETSLIYSLLQLFFLVESVLCRTTHKCLSLKALFGPFSFAMLVITIWSHLYTVEVSAGLHAGTDPSWNILNARLVSQAGHCKLWRPRFTRLVVNLVVTYRLRPPDEAPLLQYIKTQRSENNHCGQIVTMVEGTCKCQTTWCHGQCHVFEHSPAEPRL